MTLVNCPECSAQISTEAKSCPSCGYRNRKVGLIHAVCIFFFPYIFSWLTLRKGYSRQSRIISFGWLAVFFCVFIAIQYSAEAPKAASESTAIDSTQPVPKEKTESPKSINPQHWEYSSKEDKMRNQTSFFAHCLSNDTKDFGFPYHKVQQMITLRNTPSQGFDIMLNLTEGQYSCGFDGCSVNVKFDEGQIQKFNVTTAADGDSKTLFIGNKKKFLDKLMTSSKVMIESNYFQIGAQAFEFSTTGLEWTHK